MKIKRGLVIVSSAAVLAAALTAVVLFSAFSVKGFDKDEKILMDTESVKETLVTHTFDNGGELDMIVSSVKTQIAENTYMVRVIVEQNASDKQEFELSRLSAVLDIGGAYAYSPTADGNGEHFVPEVSYTGENRGYRITGTDYICFESVIQTENKDPELILDLSYNISGKGIYFFNSFYNNKLTAAL